MKKRNLILLTCCHKTQHLSNCFRQCKTEMVISQSKHRSNSFSPLRARENDDQVSRTTGFVSVAD